MHIHTGATSVTLTILSFPIIVLQVILKFPSIVLQASHSYITLVSFYVAGSMPSFVSSSRQLGSWALYCGSSDFNCSHICLVHHPQPWGYNLCLSCIFGLQAYTSLQPSGCDLMVIPQLELVATSSNSATSRCKLWPAPQSNVFCNIYRPLWLHKIKLSSHSDQLSTLFWAIDTNGSITLSHKEECFVF